MTHLVAAPDKFRATAAAADVAAAIGRAARAAGWSVDEVPLADGGEGLLDVVGGEPRSTVVTGPLGQSVSAEWRITDGVLGGSTEPTAVIEMARAAGRGLVPRPSGDDPVRATTRGVGELVLAAVDAGVRRIVVGIGGSATTDGGLGAVDAIGSPDVVAGVELLVAVDVRARFEDAAAVFGPQKGASPAQVRVLGRRLADLAARYREQFGVDVTRIAGAGAGGGLAGGLAALGATVVGGFDVVADLVGLDQRLAGADVVVTGEGRLDRSSLDGKVVGGVVARVAGRSPVLVVAGQADPAASARLPATVEVVDLTETAGRRRARADVTELVEAAVGRYL
ncbi:MAG TPA: glycerate kinase, partial [Acidimicrobiales bacterium]